MLVDGDDCNAVRHDISITIRSTTKAPRDIGVAGAHRLAYVRRRSRVINGQTLDPDTGIYCDMRRQFAPSGRRSQVWRGSSRRPQCGQALQEGPGVCRA